MQNGGQRVVGFPWLTKRNNRIVSHGVSLLLGRCGRLQTPPRYATPFSNHHPLSAIALDRMRKPVMPFDMERFSRLRRREKVVLQVLADSILILLSFLIAMAFRLESYQFLGFLKDVLIWKSIAIAVPFTILAFSVFGLYRSLVLFVKCNILLTI
jgi:hypothetical protein